jgi:hypothetical protein
MGWYVMLHPDAASTRLNLHLLQLNALKRFLGVNRSGHESLMNRLSKVFGGAKSIAASVFMETAATAALYSKAVALVINYIFNNSKVKDVHSNLHPKDAEGDGKVISLIREALRKKLRSRGLELGSHFCGCRPPGPRSLLGWTSSGRETDRDSFRELWVRFSIVQGNGDDPDSLQTVEPLVLRKGPCLDVLNSMDER